VRCHVPIRTASTAETSNFLSSSLSKHLKQVHAAEVAREEKQLRDHAARCFGNAGRLEREWDGRRGVSSQTGRPPSTARGWPVWLGIPYPSLPWSVPHTHGPNQLSRKGPNQLSRKGPSSQRGPGAPTHAAPAPSPVRTPPAPRLPRAHMPARAFF
jgi:hypothetical protein